VPGVPRPVVVMVLNSAYTRVFENFIRAPGAHHLAAWETHIICTDRATAVSLAKLGWRCQDTVKTGRSAAQVYTRRIPYVAHLVHLGRDVLITDVDAIWLGDPLPDIMATQAGIIGSRGRSPHLDWGASLCMGFIFFRGSDPLVRAAMPVLTEPMREDQTDFNHNMQRERLVWDEGRVRFVDSIDTSFGTLRPKNANAGHAGLRVAMLPHKSYVRICEDKVDYSTVIIAHCHSRGKRAHLKVQSLGAKNLWYIPEKGRPDIDPHPPMPQPGTARWSAFVAQQRAPASNASAPSP